MKPKRAQKASDRLVSSRKKLRKEDGVRANEALLKQLKQVTPEEPVQWPLAAWGMGSLRSEGMTVTATASQLRPLVPPRNCPSCP